MKDIAKRLDLPRLIEHSAVRYAAVGVVNTIVGLSLIYAMKFFFGFGDALANLIGYAIALSGGYVLNARWTFDYKGANTPAIVKYLIVLAAAYLCNLVTVLGAIDWLHIDGYLAQPLGVAPYAIVGYLGNRYFAFKSETKTAP